MADDVDFLPLESSGDEEKEEGKKPAPKAPSGQRPPVEDESEDDSLLPQALLDLMPPVSKPKSAAKTPVPKAPAAKPAWQPTAPAPRPPPPAPVPSASAAAEPPKGILDDLFPEEPPGPAAGAPEQPARRSLEEDTQFFEPVAPPTQESVEEALQDLFAEQPAAGGRQEEGEAQVLEEDTRFFEPMAPPAPKPPATLPPRPVIAHEADTRVLGR